MDQRLSGGPARDGAVDLVKTAAIFGVLVIHICVAAYAAPLGSFEWCSAVFWGSVSRAAVPLFLMCSGALLLDPARTLTLKKLWLKNIPRILAAMVVWAMVYKLAELLKGGPGAVTPGALFQAFKEVLLFKQEFHFYYLHIILLVYAFLPVTRVFVAHGSRRELLYFLLLWGALGIVYPIALKFWPFSLLSATPVQWMINQAYAGLGYGVLGYFLKREGPRRVWPWALLFAGGTAMVLGGTVGFSLAKGQLYTLFLEAMSPGVALQATGLFGVCAALVRSGRGAGRWVTHVSRASFCIYLSHILILHLLQGLGFTVAVLPRALSIPLLTAAVYLGCEALYLVLSRIPVVRDYLI